MGEGIEWRFVVVDDGAELIWPLCVWVYFGVLGVGVNNVVGSVVDGRMNYMDKNMLTRQTRREYAYADSGPGRSGTDLHGTTNTSYQLIDPTALLTPLLLDPQEVFLPVPGLVLPLGHFATELGDGVKVGGYCGVLMGYLGFSFRMKGEK